MMYMVLIVLFLWKVFLCIAAAYGTLALPFAPRFPYADIYLIPSGLPQWIWSFANFDGVHYLTIAKMGYSAQFTQAFFPLYPLLIKFIAPLFFNNFLISGLFISNIFFIVSIFLFIKLLLFDGFQKDTKWIIGYILLFPFSFYFGSVYTESFFLFLVLASFLAARHRYWFVAAFFGGLASATRLVGVFLLPALLVEWFSNRNQKRRSILQLCWLFFIPVGLLIYMAYLSYSFGDALYFWHAQSVFGAQRSGSGIIFPPQVLWRYIKILATIPYPMYDFWVALWEGISFILGITLIIIGYFKRIRLSYLVFCAFCIIIPSLTGTFSSMPRYLIIAFPIYIVLGTLENKIFRIAILFINAILLFIFTILFTSGRWVA